MRPSGEGAEVVPVRKERAEPQIRRLGVRVRGEDNRVCPVTMMWQSVEAQAARAAASATLASVLEDGPIHQSGRIQKGPGPEKTTRPAPEMTRPRGKRGWADSVSTAPAANLTLRKRPVTRGLPRLTLVLMFRLAPALNLSA